MSHMSRKHITLWLGCNVCETCSKASMTMTMKLHKEVDHKNSESITNFTSFFLTGGTENVPNTPEHVQ